MYKKLVRDMVEKQLRVYFDNRTIVIHKDMKLEDNDATGTATIFSKDYSEMLEFRYNVIGYTGNILIKDRTNGYQTFYIY